MESEYSVSITVTPQLALLHWADDASKSPAVKEYTLKKDSCCRLRRSQSPTTAPSDILALGKMGTLHSGLRACGCVLLLLFTDWGSLCVCRCAYHIIPFQCMMSSWCTRAHFNFLRSIHSYRLKNFACPVQYCHPVEAHSSKANIYYMSHTRLANTAAVWYNWSTARHFTIYHWTEKGDRPK